MKLNTEQYLKNITLEQCLEGVPGLATQPPDELDAALKALAQAGYQYALARCPQMSQGDMIKHCSAVALRVIAVAAYNAAGNDVEQMVKQFAAEQVALAAQAKENNGKA